MVHQVKDKEDFDERISNAGNKLVVVDFFAVWCGPCKVIAPQVDAWSKSMSDVVFLKVDVDILPDLTKEYEVSCMPTFVFIKGGEKVDAVEGSDEDKVMEMIDKYK